MALAYANDGIGNLPGRVSINIVNNIGLNTEP